MPVRIDPHTHSLASVHAYSTIRELALAAREKGLRVLGVTDHGPDFLGPGADQYFQNFHAIDRDRFGLRLLMGVEANIRGEDGELDLPPHVLAQMDLVVVSFHRQCFAPSPDIARNTRAAIAAIANPCAVIAGHLDDGRFPIDYDAVVRAAVQSRVLVEVNNASLTPVSFRLNGRENYKKLLESCAKYGAEVILSSDAHFESAVGEFPCARALLREVSFPPELVLNGDIDRFLKYLKKN